VNQSDDVRELTVCKAYGENIEWRGISGPKKGRELSGSEN